MKDYRAIWLDQENYPDFTPYIDELINELADTQKKLDKATTQLVSYEATIGHLKDALLEISAHIHEVGMYKEPTFEAQLAMDALNEITGNTTTASYE